jgi:C-terminal processing protease CtpA/Prc
VHEDEFSPEIGSDMLSQYKITIDVDQSMLYVKNGVANKAAIGDGCSGCVVAMSNDHVAAAEIDPTSPADIAGIKVGDRILAIDGQNMDGELPGAIQGLLDGAIGQKSDVTVVGADGKQRTCTLVRVSGFKRVEPGAGISLSWLPNKPLYVSHLEPDCTGERAGLRIGDEVVGLNGQKHSFTSQYIKYALSASTVDITVVRGDHELTCHLTTAPNTPLGK